MGSPKKRPVEDVEEMLKNELKVDAIVEKAFWTKKGTNMVVAKIKDKEQKKEFER